MLGLCAILTYNRPDYLKQLLRSIEGHSTRVVVFDDTSDVEYIDLPVTFKSKVHGGVARNSNRAIKYFKQHPEYDVMFLCNDDILVDPTAFGIYIEAIRHTGYGHFCYTDDHSPYRAGPGIRVAGIDLVHRRVGDGAFMTITRKMVDVLGGFDVSFGVFGGEHLDYSRRAAAAGFSLDSLDVAAAKDLIKVRQYYEDVPRALGRQTNHHLEIGRARWVEVMSDDPVIYKEIIT